jgi:hypothetical protein
VQDSRCFSNLRAFAILLAMLGCACATQACATVRPEEREYLAEPALTWGGESMADDHERHVLDNREASTGGGTVSGGGCGCN